jgi:hypothetical protein
VSRPGVGVVGRPGGPGMRGTERGYVPLSGVEVGRHPSP